MTLNCIIKLSVNKFTRQNGIQILTLLLGHCCCKVTCLTKTALTNGIITTERICCRYQSNIQRSTMYEETAGDITNYVRLVMHQT